MARIGVTYADITHAAMAIRADGQEPTVDRVREQLGTGSKSTIGPLLKRWRSENDTTQRSDGLPEELMAAVQALHVKMQCQAQEQIDAAQQGFQQSNDELKQQLAQLNDENQRLTNREKVLEQQLQQSHDEISALTQTLEYARIAAVKSDAQRDQAHARIDDLKSTITELKQEGRDLRDHFEHYQQQSADERQQARDQFQLSLQQSENQLEVATGQIRQLNTQLSEQQESSNQQQQALQRDIYKAQAAVVEKQQQLSDERNLRATTTTLHESECQALSERCDALSDQLQLGLSREQQLEVRNTESQDELLSTLNQLSRERDEKQQALVDKALIEGELKQLRALSTQ